MIAILPASIETYLKDAKFSTTEILVIRKLLEEDALTLRELATKTGKSTGVLDQAVKKLLGKGIVNKKAINDGFKFTMGSLKPILDWMEKDMEQKYDMLERRHQNFEAFIESLAVDKGRPEMQYFDGEEGIKRAYIKLLDPKQELLCYWPMECNWEDHPLKDFYVQYFRERHRRQIFSRVISHDTSFGRRFQSRDPFEYRKTILVPEADLPLPFEKLIAGDVVACFNHKQKQACFIKYPEFAHAERMLFENHWKEIERKQREPTIVESAAATETVDEPVLTHAPAIELKTKVFSQLRDFFLSKGSLVSFGVFLAIAGAVTFGLYKQNEYVNLQRMREKVESIAATAALQFDAKDLDVLQVEKDWEKPEWAKVVHQLESIRESNKDLMYAYIIRSVKERPDELEFVSDSHSINPYANVDADPTNDVDVDPNDVFDLNNGVTSTGANYLQWPGQSYPNAPKEALQAVHGTAPLSSQNFYTDQWGTMITGYASVKDAQGNTVAVVGVDMTVGKLEQLKQESFAVLWYLFGFFVLFVIIRFAAMHRSLMAELGKIASLRNLVWSFVLCALLAVGGTYLLNKQAEYLNLQRLREQVKSIAATGALQFDSRDLDELMTPEDIRKSQYAKVIGVLNEIRSSNEGVKYAYIMRFSSETGSKLTFVADADSLDPSAKKDLNGNGVIDQEDALSSPGDSYPEVPNSMLIVLKENRATADELPFSDQWGVFISGAAPIHDASGKTVALLGIDKLASDTDVLAKETNNALYLLLGLILLFSALNRSLIKSIWTFKSVKNSFVTLVFCMCIALIGTYGVYLHTMSIVRAELSDKLMAIAVTSAAQFSIKDLDQLRFARDMKKEAYQRVFKQLNDIRNKNKDVEYVFVMRRISNETAEFVADADSNYSLPFLVDMNKDSVLNEADEAVAPGVRYWSQSPYFKLGFFGPQADPNPMTDQWGTFITGFSPISSETSEYMIEVDMDISNTQKNINDKFKPWIWLNIIFWPILFCLAVIQYMQKGASQQR